MLISHVSGAEPPKDFLASDDPIWKQVLAEQVSFSKTRITIREAIDGLIGIPHISSSGGEFQNVVINLPTTKLDQRSLLWILHQQTGAEISVSGMKPDGLRGTLSLMPQNKPTMPIRSRDESIDPFK